MPFERLLAAPLIGLLRLLGRLPLGLYHSLGARLGRLAYHFSPRVSRRIRDHLKLSGVCASEAEYERVLRVNIDETGKQAIEMLALWFRPEREASALVRSCRGEQEVQAAYREGRGVILLTPHLGCFEVAAIYAAQQVPITVLYRQPRVTWLRPLIVAGRERGRLKLAPASVHGVRLLLGALRRGEAIGILPDQVPRFGEGLWVDFFGRPAYTMTLIGRLWQVTRAPVFVATAIRRPNAQGYDIEVKRIEGDLSGEAGVRRINQAIEEAVRACPEQYLWAYSRHKTPDGAPPKPVRPANAP